MLMVVSLLLELPKGVTAQPLVDIATPTLLCKCHAHCTVHKLHSTTFHCTKTVHPLHNIVHLLHNVTHIFHHVVHILEYLLYLARLNYFSPMKLHRILFSLTVCHNVYICEQRNKRDSVNVAWSHDWVT